LQFVKTEKFADFKPTKKKNAIQEAQRNCLGVPQEGPKERLRFGKVVEAG
jgi:hypothetical protein